MRGNALAARTVAWIALLALVASESVVPTAAAHHTGATKSMGRFVNETVVLPPNNWTAYEAHIGSEDSVPYDIDVIVGSMIDIYIVPEDGFSMYRRDPMFAFTYYEEFENGLGAAGYFYNTAEQTETVYFIVDNVDFSGAEPSGDVTVHVNLGTPPLEPISPIVPAVFAVGFASAVLVGAWLVVRQRKRRAAVLPPPSSQPLQPPPPPP